MVFRISRPLIIIAIILSIVSFSVPNTVQANPIAINIIDGGHMFCFSSNTTLPTASVNISIFCHEGIIRNETFHGYLYDVSLNSAFTVISEETRNETIAFAYPGDWNHYAPTTMYLSDFTVKVDEEEVPFTISLLQDAVSNLTQNGDNVGDYDWEFLQDHEFVIFNMSLIANQEMVFEVNAEWTMCTRATYLTLSYCVGTARAWKGNTIEQVRFDVYQIHDREDYEFYPEESIEVTDLYFDCSAQWNIDFESFEYDHVGIEILQNRGNSVLFEAFTIPMMVIVVIFVLTRFHRESEHLNESMNSE